MSDITFVDAHVHFRDPAHLDHDRRTRRVRDDRPAHRREKGSWRVAGAVRMPAWRGGSARPADHGLSFDLHCHPGDLAACVPPLPRHDAVRAIGMPVLADPEGRGQWRGDRPLSAYRAIVADGSRAECGASFGGNANRLYRFDLDLETRL